MKNIDCELFNDSDERIFSVNRLKRNGNIDLYVFSRDISDLKAKDFMKDRISNVFFIEKAIYQDDTIYNFKFKISSIMKESVESVFLFQEKEVNKQNKEFIIHNFLRSCFRKGTFMTTSRFNRLLNMYFVEGVTNISFRTDADIIRYDQARELLTKKKSKVLKNVKKYYHPVSFELKDNHEVDVLFAINPYDSVQMDDEDFKTSINHQHSHNMMDIGTFNKNNEIFVVCRSDYDEFITEVFGTHKKKLLDFYFKDETKEGHVNNAKYEKLLNKIDEIKNKVNLEEYFSSVQNINCRLVDVKLSANPIPKQYTSKKIKHNSEYSSVNLKKVFHLLTASSIAPFISYKGKNNEYYYRVLKYGLPELITKKRYDKWITQERKFVKDRSNDSITIKAITNENIVSSIILRESGNYDIYIKFPAVKNIQIRYLNELITNLNQSIIGEISNLTQYDESKISSFNLNVNGELAEYKTIVLITTNEKIATKPVLIKRLEKNMYFSMIKDMGNNELLLKYKRVSNYAEMDAITGFLNSNYNLKKDDLIEKMVIEFSLDHDTATKEWEKRKDDIQLQLINNNGHITYKNKYTEGIIVRLKLLNHNQFELSLQNATRTDYHDNIIKVMILMLSKTEKINFNIDDSNKRLMEVTQEEQKERSGDTFTMALLNQVNEPLNEADEKVDNEDDDDSSIISADSLDLYSVSPGNEFLEDENEDDVLGNAELRTMLNNETVRRSPIETEDDVPGTVVDVNNEFKDVNMDDKMMKRYHTKFINDRLKNADSELFVKGYSKHCGAVDRKQPVVLTKLDKERVDAHNRNAYTGYIKTGSTPELTERNYYICPLIWCPISKVAMTAKEMEENGNMCPKPNQETPLILHNKKDNVKKALGDYKKYPYLMKQNLHPGQKEMVCCGYKPNPNVKYDENKVTNDANDSIKENDNKNDNTNRYIRKMVGLPVEDDRLASLPVSLNNILNPGKTIEMCSGLRNESKDNCFIRLGLGLNVKNRFLNALVNTLNNPKVTTVKELGELINSDLSLHEYIMLNHGNTMKTYVPYSFDEHKVYKKYKQYVKSKKGQTYIRALNLYEIFNFVNNNNDLDVNDEMYKRIKRELTMFASFDNFKEYMKDDLIEKDSEEMYGLTKLHFLNPYRLVYIILNTSDEDDITILCQKYSLSHVDESSKCVFLLHNRSYYELLIRNKSCCSIETMKEPFSVKDDGIRDLINIYKSNCGFVGKNVKLSANDVYLKLLDMYRNDFFKCKNIQKKTPGEDIVVILNYNIRIVGFLIKPTGFYIPLDNDEYITKFFFDEICEHSNSAVYMDDMSLLIDTDMVCNDKKVYKAVLNNLKSIDMFYDELLKDDKQIDLHVSIQDEIDEEMLNLFIGHVTDDARLNFMNEYEKIEEDKLTLIKLVIKELNDNPIFQKRLDLIRHDLNPYPEKEKIIQMRDELKHLIGKIQYDKEVSDELLDVLTEEFYNKGIVVLEKIMYTNPVINMNIEILYTLKDLMSDALYEHYLMAENPYKSLKNSIEDLIMEYNVLTLRTDDTLSDEQYSFKKIQPNDMYNSGKIHPLMMGTVFNKTNTADVFIKLFDKINNELFQNKFIKLTKEYVIENMISKLTNLYTTNENKKLIRYWMNVFNQNNVQIAKKTENPLVITNQKNKFEGYEYNIYTSQDLSNILRDINYKWGLFELGFMCKAYSLGLIILSRTKTNPTKLVDVKIRDNMELVLPSDKSAMEKTRYVIVFLSNSNDVPSPYYIMMKSRDRRYEQLIYSWNELTSTMHNTLRREKTEKIKFFDKLFV
jgi:hypothetical protein